MASAKPQSRWELVRETGLEYAESDELHVAVDLKWPVVAAHLPGVGYLIVDECLVPSAGLRQHCRTLLLTAAGETIYDSHAHGIDNGYGCTMSGGQFAILWRTRREILVLSGAGACLRRIDLSRISRHPPRILSWTHRGTFLVNFLTLGQPFEIVEVDIEGRVLWSLPGTHIAARTLVSLQLLANGSVLVANQGNHVVQELHRDGSTSIRWGKRDSPSREHGHLSGPTCAEELDDGTLLIADGQNHRCLAIDAGGGVTDIRPAGQSLFMPSFITRASGGNLLMGDVGLRCIFELDETRRVVRQFGASAVRKRHFSFPRSVQCLDRGRYFIADTANDRVVEFDGRRLREIPVGSDRRLFWPRAARSTDQGNLLIADGRNSRVLKLSPDGGVLRQLSQVRYEGRTVVLQDPHDIRPLPDDTLLITDAARNMVVETDWEGRAVSVIGLDGEPALADPHSAQLLSDGRIMIADSGHDRILFVDARTGVHSALTEFPTQLTGGGSGRLSAPKYAEVLADGTLVIVDTGNHRVLVSDLARNFLWELSQIPESPIPYLRFPRWAHPISRDEIVVSDHLNHRILHFLRRDK